MLHLTQKAYHQNRVSISLEMSQLPDQKQNWRQILHEKMMIAHACLTSPHHEQAHKKMILSLQELQNALSFFCTARFYLINSKYLLLLRTNILIKTNA